MKHINDVPGYPAPHSPFSHAVVANGFVFVSGQVGAGANIQEQTRHALRNVEKICRPPAARSSTWSR